MNKEEYNQAKEEIIKLYGPAVRGNGFETENNETVHKLNELKAQYLASIRAEKKQQNRVVEAPKAVLKADLSVSDVRTKLENVSGFVPLESDLNEFKEVDKEILRVFLVNQHTSPKTLSYSFGKTYQYIAALLNSKSVQLLRAKYFHKQLDDNTKMGLLQLTKDADPKIVLASAEYLRILHEDDKKEDSANRLQDPRAEKALMLLGDWLADDSVEELVIKRSELG